MRSDPKPLCPGARSRGAWRPREAGFTLYEIMIVIALIALVASFAVPGMLDARRVANETSAVATLRSIFDAQGSYARKYPIGSRTSPFASSLAVLAEVDLLPAVLSPVAGAGATGGPAVYKHDSYLFISGLLDGDSEMFIAATPEALGKTGTFSFLMKEDGVIYRRVGPLFVDSSLGTPIG